MSRIDLLRQTTLFADLPDDILQALADSLGKRTFAKGMVLFHKGSPGQRLYLVETGLVRIFVLSDAGHEITLNIHGPGECFGELALLDGGPRSAGAVAMETLVAYTLDREDFLDLVEAHPKLARRALERVSERLRHLTAHVESLSFPGHHRPCRLVPVGLCGAPWPTHERRRGFADAPDPGRACQLRRRDARECQQGVGGLSRRGTDPARRARHDDPRPGRFET